MKEYRGDSMPEDSPEGGGRGGVEGGGGASRVEGRSLVWGVEGAEWREGAGGGGAFWMAACLVRGGGGGLDWWWWWC